MCIGRGSWNEGSVVCVRCVWCTRGTTYYRTSLCSSLQQPPNRVDSSGDQVYGQGSPL